MKTIEQLEQEIARLRQDVDYWKADSAAAWDKCEEYRQQVLELQAENKTLAEQHAQMLVELTQTQVAVKVKDEALKEITYESGGHYFIGEHGDADVTEKIGAALSIQPSLAALLLHEANVLREAGDRISYAKSYLNLLADQREQEARDATD